MDKFSLQSILMTTDTIGGVWNFTNSLIKELQKYNLQIKLVTLGRQLSDAQRKEIKNFNNLAIFENECKLEWMENPWDDITKSCNWIQDIVRQENPDIIHFNSFTFNSLSFGKPTMCTAHSCVLSWYQNVKGTRPSGNWDFYYRFVKSGLHRVNYVTVPSKFMERQINKFYNRNCLVIYNGVEQNSNITSKEQIVYSVGRVWDEAKNFSILSEIASYVEWPIIISGSTKLETQGKTNLVENNNVQYLGECSSNEIYSLMKKSSIFVSTSLYEPFGLAVLEAASNGCALILPDIDSFIEIWGDAALFYKKNSSHSLLSAIKKLTSNSILLSLYSKKALEQSSKYSIVNTASQYYSLYCQLHQNNMTMENAI